MLGSSVFSVTWLCNIRHSVSQIQFKFSKTLTRSVLSTTGNWNSCYNATESRQLCLLDIPRNKKQWLNLVTSVCVCVAVEKCDSHCKDGGVQTGAGLAEWGSSEGIGSNLWFQDEMNDRWKGYCRILVLPVAIRDQDLQI